MKAAIISLGSLSSQWTYDEMKKLFDDVDMLNLSEFEICLGDKEYGIFHDGRKLQNKYDCVFIKGSFRYAVPMGIITRSFAESGKTFLPTSADAYTVAPNKILTALALQLHKVPTPKTYLASSVESAKKILNKLNFPVIIKFPSGTQGKGVMVAESYASASSMLDALEALHQSILLQEYVETGGKDIRAIVVGDKVVACMQRRSQKGEVRANIHAGGTGIPYFLDEKGEMVAVGAARAVGAGICGVDLLEGAGQYYVLEVNLSPGLQGITAATKINVAEKIAKYLFKEAKEMHKSHAHKGGRQIMQDAGIAIAGKHHQEIITNIDLRGNRILLPEIISKVSRIRDTTDVVIKVEEGKISIERF